MERSERIKLAVPTWTPGKLANGNAQSACATGTETWTTHLGVRFWGGTVGKPWPKRSYAGIFEQDALTKTSAFEVFGWKGSNKGSLGERSAIV